VCGDASNLLQDLLEDVGDILCHMIHITMAVLQLMDSDLVSDGAGGTNILPLDLLTLGSPVTSAQDRVASVSPYFRGLLAE